MRSRDAGNGSVSYVPFSVLLLCDKIKLDQNKIKHTTACLGQVQVDSSGVCLTGIWQPCKKKKKGAHKKVDMNNTELETITHYLLILRDSPSAL